MTENRVDINNNDLFKEHEMFPSDKIAFYKEKAEEMPLFKNVLLGYLWSTYSICLSLTYPTLFEKGLRRIVADSNESDVWQELSFDPKIKEALLVSQPAALISLWDAYERFVCESLKIACRLQGIEIRKWDDFKEHFELCFGKEAFQRCWQDKEIQTFFEIRDALVKSDGVLSQELEELLQGTGMIRSGLLNIRSWNNDYLWAALCGGSYFLIKTLSSNYEKMIGK